ncbi:MAG: hypothetical protein ACPGTO_09180 [Polaribacter sp.]
MKKKPLLLYLDTSVIGGYFDIEFEKETRLLFDSILKRDYEILYSSVTKDELLEAPKPVRILLNEIPNDIKKYVELSKEATELGDAYIAEKVVGKTSREDCFHIALATIHKADILVSWSR